MFSYLIGLNNSFMLVQGIVTLLLRVGVYRFAQLWTSDRAASYAAFGSIFLGSLSLLVYQDGQIGTTSSTALFFLSVPYIYQYALHGKFRDLLLGLFISFSAAAAHHATLLFGVMFFVGPVVWLALSDYRAEQPGKSLVAPIGRIVLYGGLAAIGIGVVLLPYFIILLKYPIKQIPTRISFFSHSGPLTTGSFPSVRRSTGVIRPRYQQDRIWNHPANAVDGVKQQVHSLVGAPISECENDSLRRTRT
jgi:hypothetical protein